MIEIKCTHETENAGCDRNAIGIVGYFHSMSQSKYAKMSAVTSYLKINSDGLSPIWLTCIDIACTEFITSTMLPLSARESRMRGRIIKFMK